MSSSKEIPARPTWSAALAASLEQVAHEAEAMVARTERWSALNSGSYELVNLARMRDVLSDAFAVLPGPVEIVPLPPTQRVGADGGIGEIALGSALRIRVRPEASLQIALTGHYDTVFPSSHPFQSPWRADANTLRGPGVADMKGGLSLMLAALEAFERLPGAKRVGYCVLLSPDEEIGSPGSAHLLAELGAHARLGLTYEPALANGALVDARKGSGNYALAFKGRAAHVGRAFEDGRSAVLAAAQAALALDALNGRRDGVTVNVGAIDGGGPSNVVPERAVLRFNVRAPDADSALWAQAELDALVAAGGWRKGVSAALHGGFGRPPKPLSPAQRTMIEWTRAAGDELGLALAFQPSGGVCEGNNLAAAGCPNIDTLGPCGGGLHGDDEFVLLDSFATRAQLSFLLLAGLERGVFNPEALRT